MNAASRSSWGGRVVVVAFAVSILAVSALGLAFTPSLAHTVTPAGTSSASPAVVAQAIHHAPAATSSPLATTSSGPGTFFSTSDVGTVSAGVRACFVGSCVNVTNDPTVNLTSTGVLAVAYTAYVNQAPCAAMRGSAASEVGVRTSSDGGATFSSVQYLGNPKCSSVADQPYDDAWEPSITSLANGTLVLAYIEFNVTSLYALPEVEFGPFSWDVTYDRLVVTESYNGGSTWTTPTVINSSANPTLSALAFAPQRPSITATGNTVYLAWYNLTSDPGVSYASYPPTPYGNASAGVHLVASTNGGTTWGSADTLPSLATVDGNYSINPFAVVTPSGELLVAYTTNLTFHPTYGCVNGGCFSAIWTTDVVMASSVNNGSTFTLDEISPNVPWAQADYTAGPWHDPAPQLAYSDLTGQLFASFGAGSFHPWCYPSYGCGSYEDPEVPYVANSSSVGATWSSAHSVAPSDLYEYPFTSSWLLLPSIAVGPAGALELSMVYINGSTCDQTYPYGCLQSQVFTTSVDNGSTFGPMYAVTANSSVLGFFGSNAPVGHTAAVLSDGSNVWLAWTNVVCPASLPVGSCTYPSSYGAASVEVSKLFTGTGLYLDFHAVGVPTGTPWSVDVLGNIRAGTTPTDLNFSGIPSGDIVGWPALADLPLAYGVEAHPTTSVAPPLTLAANTTVTATYTNRYLLNLETVPAFPTNTAPTTYCNGYEFFTWDYPSCPLLNLNLTPMPGQYWESPGTVVPINITPNPMYCGSGTFCYSTAYGNLSFTSWSGSGNGSVSSLSPNVTVTVNGPINETGSFLVNGWCNYDYTALLTTCLGSNTSMLFQETGLPTGTSWSVTLSNGVLNTTNSTSTNQLAVSGPWTIGVLSYQVWTIPAPGGKYWVADSTPVSPVVLPSGGLVQVHFTLQSVASDSFPVELVTNGLPLDSSWTYTLDGSTVGVDGTSSVELSLPVGSHTVTAGTVTLSNDTGYGLSAVDLFPMIVNQTWSNTSTIPATVSINGPSEVVLTFGTVYFLSASSSAGGSIAGGNLWVAPGRSATLNATANPGDYFVGWTGTGFGGVTSNHASIVVTVRGPIDEVATFEPNPLPTWTVNVSVEGLPTGTAYSLAFGPTVYSGSGTIQIPNLASGSYALGVPFVYLNSSDQTRFVLSSTVSSLPQNPDGSYQVDENGTLTLSFLAESTVTLAVGPGGSVSWSALAPPAVGDSSGGVGAAWVEVGTSIQLVASPTAGFQSTGWAGAGASAVNSTQAAVGLTVTGPVSETASFMLTPTVVRPTYTLTLEPVGLPTGVSWNATLGTIGGSATGGSITLTGLNGSYTVTVPTVLRAPGDRFENSSGSFTVLVTGDTTVQVAFTEQFFVSISAATGGTVGVVGGWMAPGTNVTLSETASTGYVFEGWNGTGTGSYTGSATGPKVTVGGPLTEVARFAAPPAAPTTSTTTSTSGLPIALGLLVGLLVVGLIAGLLLGRRQPPAYEEPTEPVYDAPPPTPDAVDGSGGAEEPPVS